MRKCIITVASNMTEETYLYLVDKIKRQFGFDLVVGKAVDDSIIGGFIINIDGQVFDLSVKTQLDEMKRHLTA